MNTDVPRLFRTLGRRELRRSPVAVVLGLALAVLAAGVRPVGEEQAEAAPAAPAPGGLEVRSVEQLTPRLQELVVHSPALGRDTGLRVLTPTGFDPSRDHLPVLWLFHGGFGGYRDWTGAGQAEALTADLPLIVVMPDSGPGGWYADWDVEETSQGRQRWETYHVDELIPFVQDRYRTRTDRSGSAVAGLSMGGFGALHHAARHPDRYGFAAAFSGAVDNLHPGIAGIIQLSPLIMGGQQGDIWGLAGTNESHWRAENPVDLAANLATVELQLRTGNGQPGGAHGGEDPVQEAAVSEANLTLHRRLDELGIAHVHDDAPGTHAWPYWRDDLVATLPAIVAATAEVRPDPTTVDHLAFEPSFSVWGHDVALDRRNLESTILAVRPDGFGLSGSGRGTVTTPGRYRPGQRLVATTTVVGTGAEIRSEVVADDAGRAVVPVDLGPANVADEHDPAARATRAVVRIDVAIQVAPDPPATSTTTPTTTTSAPATTVPGSGVAAAPAAVAVTGAPRYTG